MKLITKDTDNAIVALLALSQAGGRTLSAAELSGQSGIPYPFMRRILQTLAASGIVASRRGMGGGFTLTRTPEDVSVRDIVEIFQGPVAIQGCRVGDDLCERAERCVLRRKLLTMESQLVSDLMKITLASLVKEGQKPPKRT